MMRWLISVAAVAGAILISASSALAQSSSGPEHPRVESSASAAGVSTVSQASDRRSAQRKRAAARRRQAAKRRAGRRQLLKIAKTKPHLITTSAYVRKAAALGFELPMMLRFQTVLLDSPLTLAPASDTWQVDPGNGAVSPPAFLGGSLAGPQTATLSGTVRLYAIFLDPRIADKPGTLRLNVSDIDLESSPVVLATKECVPGVPVDYLKTGVIDLGMDTTFDSLGVTNLFTGEMNITLNMSLAFNSYRDDDCDGIFDATRRATTPNGGGQRPVSLRMVGESRVSPAITKDGFIRMLLQTVDNLVEAQPAFDQAVNTCTTVPPPPGATCSPGDGDNQVIQTKFKALNVGVEVLVGH